jgi:hypothetical protein
MRIVRLFYDIKWHLGRWEGLSLVVQANTKLDSNKHVLKIENICPVLLIQSKQKYPVSNMSNLNLRLLNSIQKTRSTKYSSLFPSCKV